MKKIYIILLASVVLLSGCSSPLDEDIDSAQSDVTTDASIYENESTLAIEDELIEEEKVATPVENESTNADVEYGYTVVNVVDGDTIKVSKSGTTEKVRMIGVDTPESVHPDASRNSESGKKASKFTEKKLSGKTVGLEFDVQQRDQYGRLLAYVYVGDKMFNKTLLRKGYAQVATYPPNVKYVDDFTKIQKKARKNNKGLWGEDEKQSSPKKTGSKKGKYRAHTKNMKFHAPGCRFGDMISDSNLVLFKSRDKAIDEGYAPCKVCNP